MLKLTVVDQVDASPAGPRRPGALGVPVAGGLAGIGVTASSSTRQDESVGRATDRVEVHTLRCDAPVLYLPGRDDLEVADLLGVSPGMGLE